jgi:hypothetical protein
MHAEILAWQAHRFAVERLKRSPPGLTGGRRLLFLSGPDPLCLTQIFPYFYHRRAIAQRWGFSLCELPLARFEARSLKPDPKVAAVAFQTWFDLDDDTMAALVARIRAAYPQARLAYLDWFGPVDLRYAAVLNDRVDVYLKKQVLRDKDGYGRPTQGGTNLTDYYGRRFGLEQAEVCHPVPKGFFDKLVLGPNFCFSPHMLKAFLGPYPTGARPHDLHARIATKGTEWYSRMRNEAREAVEALRGLDIVSQGRVPRNVFFQELRESKLCFSPFGYGEVCWRDYEAAFTGALLIKPDMAHLESRPDIFVAGETYVPIRWDLADLADSVHHYLADASARERIARNAFDRVRDYLAGTAFLDESAPLFRALGGAAGSDEHSADRIR